MQDVVAIASARDHQCIEKGQLVAIACFSLCNIIKFLLLLRLLVPLLPSSRSTHSNLLFLVQSIRSRRIKTGTAENSITHL